LERSREWKDGIKGSLSLVLEGYTAIGITKHINRNHTFALFKEDDRAMLVVKPGRA
jgi:hypothetical protein